MGKYTAYVDDGEEVNLLPRKLTPVEAQQAAKQARVLEPAPDMERIGWQNKQGYIQGQGKLQLPQANAPIPNKYSDYVEPIPQGQAAPAAPKYDVGNSFIDDVGNFAQGVRKGVIDVGLGINQRFAEGARYLESKFGGQNLNRALGWPTAQEIYDKTNQTIENRKTYYDPLMQTQAGIAGNVTGQVGVAVPSAFIPGAATLRGGAAIGGLQGFLSPTTGNESVLNNTAVGSVLGGALPAAVGAYRLGKSALAPFSTSGINDRAMKTLGAYGIKPEDLNNVDSIQTITGARPSMPEQIANPEVATSASRLQDNLATLPDQQRKFAVRNMDNNEARLKVLRDLAGEGGAKTKAEAAREAAAQVNYGEAFNAPFDINRFPQQYKTDFNDLMAKPAIIEAQRIAEKEAANRGLSFDPNTNVQSLHLIKEGLDSLLTKAEAQGSPTVGLTKTKTELVGLLKNISKSYENARVNFADMSRPINQMNVAEQLIKQGTSPIPDLYGNPQLRVGGLLQAMRDEPALIKRSTGGLYGGDGTLSGLFDPVQYSKLMAVKNETALKSAVIGAGMGSGSATAQRGVGLDMLLGGGGLILGGGGSSILRAAKGAINFVNNKVIEPRIQQTLTDMVLNPGKAQEIMKALAPKDLTIVQEALKNKFLQQSLRSSLPALYNSDNN